MIAPKLTDTQREELAGMSRYYLKHGITSSSLLVSAALARIDALEKAVEAAGGLCMCGHIKNSHDFIGGDMDCLSCDCEHFTEPQP